MHAFAIVSSILLSLGMLMSASFKLGQSPRIVRLMADVGVTNPRHLVALGALQLAAAVGLVVGIWLPPIGIAAAIGLILYFAGAIVAHIRARDTGFLAAAILLVCAGATLALLIAAA
ncbi:DoxX family protein [Microbacterium allomyrinae]|uniref:DoxX family protein n=1 Tax=Microbacterium allomyrinae TaxID=2830666 RepID=A0A9X1LVS5_9MICO|nr:DoxX family protein [Microbacterium allomyrinae]MCC2032616.1 DoxX family protein [Microbacterium allomyrinae]